MPISAPIPSIQHYMRLMQTPTQACKRKPHLHPLTICQKRPIGPTTIAHQCCRRLFSTICSLGFTQFMIMEPSTHDSTLRNGPCGDAKVSFEQAIGSKQSVSVAFNPINRCVIIIKRQGQDAAEDYWYTNSVTDTIENVSKFSLTSNTAFEREHRTYNNLLHLISALYDLLGHYNIVHLPSGEGLIIHSCNS